MKKTFFFLILLITGKFSNACDVCGCSQNNYYVGLNPQMSKNFVGIRYSYRSFESRDAVNAEEYSKDFYQTFDLWGGVIISKRWQVLAIVPYNINYMLSDEGSLYKRGLGDISLMATYYLLNKNVLTHSLQTQNHQVSVSAGVKLPSGKFELDTAEVVASANSQTGTGSTDFMMSVNYILQAENWGINTNTAYRINTQAAEFRFGNKFTTAVFVSYLHKTKSLIRLIPNGGIMYENQAANHYQGMHIHHSGGSALLAAVGLENSIRNFNIGANIMMPLVQNISAGQTNIKFRSMVHLSYSF